MDLLHRRSAVAGLKSRRARGHAIELIDELAREGVQGIAIHGLAAALGVYPLPAYRTLKTINMLFRDDDLPQLAENLARRGYKSQPHSGEFQENRTYDVFVPIMPADDGRRLVIHRAVTEPSASLDVDRIFADAQEIETEWGRCLIPAHEYGFAIIALNGFRHRYGPETLAELFDACLMLFRFGEQMDWRKVEAVARRGRFVERLVFYREILAALGAGRAPVFEDRGLSPWRRSQLESVVQRHRHDTKTEPGDTYLTVLGFLQRDSSIDVIRSWWRMARGGAGPPTKYLPGLPLAEAPPPPADDAKPPLPPGGPDALPSIRFSPTEIESRVIGEHTLLKAAKIFQESGALLIENAFEPVFINHLHETLATRHGDYFRDEDFADALLTGNRRRMFTLELEPPFVSSELYANPLVFPIIRHLIGWQCILLGFGVVVSLPGAKEQNAHRDHPYLFDEAIDLTLPPSTISMLVPLVELNDITGTTKIWRGSHAVGDDRVADLAVFKPHAPVGSCLLIDFRTMHGGAANLSDEARPIIYNMYSRPWFRDHVNYDKQPRLRISEKEFRRIPITHRYLFSWSRVDEQPGTSVIGATRNWFMKRFQRR